MILLLIMMMFMVKLIWKNHTIFMVSMTMVMIMFMFIFVVMVFKQLFINSKEYLEDKYNVGNKIKKVEALFAEPIAQAKLVGDEVEEADLKMHCEIEKQLMMKPAPETLVFFYNEAIIQLGFIAFFAVSFPFAPLMSFFTNLLEILIKLQNMANIGKRNKAECTGGIGNWMDIMGFISYFAIPMNIAILLFTRFPTEMPGII